MLHLLHGKNGCFKIRTHFGNYRLFNHISKGFDFGGFAAQRAFVREPRVAALLVDGVVHDFEALMRAYVVRVLGSWNSPLFADLLTRQVQSRCEFNLQTRLSEVSLRASFADRVANNATRIGVIRSLDDAAMPSDEQYNLLVSSVSLNDQMQAPRSFSWASNYTVPASDACDEQTALHLLSPAEYQARLCEFFGDVFSLGASCR
ncbi:unnamed protein product [Symbiodinium natans]|uniref:Uncharacterized protein n=1 Tax=Symbiodinium natans TaxID=878477 RepID=A0A812GNP9_9DINO|nr:unnamed protein product [Symbiodinium natans]